MMINISNIIFLLFKVLFTTGWLFLIEFSLVVFNWFRSLLVEQRFNRFRGFVCCSIIGFSFVSKLLLIGVGDIVDSDTRNEDEEFIDKFFRSMT